MDKGAGGQRYLLGLWIVISILTPVFGLLGARGFDPAVVVLGLLALAYLKPKGRDRIAFGLLGAVAAWAAVSAVWSPAPNLEVHSLKDFERLTWLHLIAQLALSGAFVLATASLTAKTAERVIRWLSYGLLALAVIMVEEGITQARVFQAMQVLIHTTVRQDYAVRNVALGGYVMAALIWPVGVALIRDGRRLLTLFLAASVVFSTFALRGDSPSVAIVISAGAFAAVYWRGRPAVLALAGLAGAYWLGAPLVVLGLEKGGLIGLLLGKLPVSWDQRLQAWTFTVSKWLEDPLQGWGLDASRTFPGYIPLHPHDGAIQAWFELGVVGAALIAAFFVFLLWRVAEDAKDRLFAATACATATVYLVIGAISFSLWQEWWICLGALSLAACIALKRFIGQPPPIVPLHTAGPPQAG